MKKIMKVFHLTDHLPEFHPYWGGAEQVAFRYIRLLADSGKIDLLVGSVKPAKPVTEDFRFVRIITSEDLFPQKWQIYVTGIKNRIIPLDLLSFIHLLIIFFRERPEIIHLHKTNKISFSSILAAKIMGIKIIFPMYDYCYLCPAGMLIDQEGKLCKKFHGSWCSNCDAVTVFRSLLPLTSGLRRPIFDFFYNLVDAFAVLSNSQKRILKSYGIPEEKIFLVRQVFDFETDKTATKIQKNTILFAGWLDPRKGLHVLVEAMVKVIQEIPSVKLVVLELQGIKGYKEKILKRIKTLGIGENIEFHGRITKEEFNRFLGLAQIIVVPEQWENMSPVIVVEGMARGKTMVASKIGGIPEFIKDGRNGLLVKRTNANEFAQKIIWVMQNPGEAESLGKQAAEDIRKLCHQRKILAALLKLYRPHTST